MLTGLSAAAARLRLALTRGLSRLGFREESFLLGLSVAIGIVTGAAAVGFHELIGWIRDRLYLHVASDFLYGRGLPLLVVFPALGGLLVGIISRYIVRAREGHGVIDVMESVVKTSGFVKPRVAIEKIVTAAITIGTGGSAGAEGPIVQIGAAIASGFGSLFRIARQHMPILTGCGCAAGISAIFNAPIGGVLFTLEVILQDFSIRTFTPVVVASVIANVTTRAIFAHFGIQFAAILHVIPMSGAAANRPVLDWGQVGNFVALGLICGIVGVALTRMMHLAEAQFGKLKRLGPLRPALGGTMLGLLGVIYVMIFGWLLLGQAKPFAFTHYPMPAFFGDGYGVITRLLDGQFYAQSMPSRWLLLLVFLCFAKIAGTCLTLGSGGSGGIIAPSLFLGATAGAVLGMLLRASGWFTFVQPELYAVAGMGAALAAVVHAPLASTLICFEVTEDYKVMVPALLACVISTGFARVLFRDSIYTLTLRLRGVRVGTSADLSLLRRMTVEQVDLDPAIALRTTDPFQKVLDLTVDSGATDFPVVDEQGVYVGMITADDIKTALIEREAVPLLLAGEIMRPEIPTVRNTDDLLSVLDKFSRYDLAHLPVTVSGSSGRIVAMISRKSLMQRHQRALAES